MAPTPTSENAKAVMNPTYLFLRALLIVLWPPAVMASVTIDVTINAMSVTVWAVVATLSTMGALTSLLHTLKISIPPRMFAYVSSHMLMGWLAWTIAFFIMEYLDVPDLGETPLIALAAHSGGRIMDVFQIRLYAAMDAAMSRLFGPIKSPE